MPTIGLLEILLIFVVCSVPVALIAGVVAFVVWAIRWNRGEQTIVIPSSDESRPVQ